MLKTKFNPAAPRHKVLLLTALGTLAGAGITQEAEAGITVGCLVDCQESHIETVTTDLGGLWDYDYTVFNDSAFNGDILVDWELPYFGDEGISNIRSPDGWDWEIETIGSPDFNTGWDGVAEWQTPGDDLYQGPDSPYTTVTEVLHWYCIDFGEACFDFGESPSETGIIPGDSLGGFGFEANYGPTDAPYQASWEELPVNTGDPPIPGQSGAAGPASPAAMSVPEPGTLTLAALGAIGALGVKRRRRSSG